MEVISRNDTPEFVSKVFTEWGDLFILTEEHSVFCLHKLDLQRKLSVFYEEKLFTLALTVARNNNLYYNSIVEIHKLYVLRYLFIVDTVITCMDKAITMKR